MPTDYHHTVMTNATPSVDFTKWCSGPQNEQMSGEPKKRADEVRYRRANLALLIKRDFGDNVSRFAERVNKSQPQISDMLRGAKSFGPNVARDLEDAIGLKRWQLDLDASPLEYDPAHPNYRRHQLDQLYEQLTTDASPEEKQRVVELLTSMRTPKHKKAV